MVKIHNSTKDKILKLLLSSKEKEYTIRSISHTINMDYKTVYQVVNELIDNKLIRAKRAGQTILCTINQETFNPDMFRAEWLRREDLLRNKDLYVLYKRISDVPSSFVMLLFGSYASGTQRKSSDIDIMLITDDENVKKEIWAAFSIMPLKIHLLEFTAAEFISMLKTTVFNVGREAQKNNIILHGIEEYYRMINYVK